MIRFDGKVFKKYDYFLPQNKRITAIIIYYSDFFILGFRFHLSDGSDWDIGNLGYDDDDEDDDDETKKTETVDIADNEVIVGFKSKSHPNFPAAYTEIQFLTMRKPN